MKHKLVCWYLLSLVAIFSVVVGCSKTDSKAPVALTPDQVPTTVNQAFSHSSDTTKQLADVYVTDFQNQDIPAAFTDLRKLLAQKGDLTPAQRSVAARAFMTTAEKLRTAADGGNAAAQKVLHQYISSK